jgi:hypothetical protein
MDLVDKHDHPAALRILEQAVHALFQVAAKLRASEQRAELQLKNGPPYQATRNLTAANFPREPIDQRRLPHTWFADEQRIALRASAKNRQQLLEFNLAPNNRIEFPTPREVGKIAP